MPQVTITFELTPENMHTLNLFADMLAPSNKTKGVTEQISLPFLSGTETAEQKTVVTSTSDTQKDTPVVISAAPSAGEEKVISLTDVRAVALKLSKAGKQKTLKEIFAKYSAEKLSDISQDNYPALLADLEAANA